MTIRTLLLVTRKTLPVLLAITLSACGSHSSEESVAAEPAEARCGDGRVDLGEECDGTDLAGRSCRSFRRDSAGTLACRADCTFEVADCTNAACGNGRIDTAVGSGPELCEWCDGSDLGGRSCRGFGGSGDLACNNGCTTVRASCNDVCQNGRLEPGEACDVDPATYQAILPVGLSCESLGLGHGELYCGLGGGGLATPFGTVAFAGCQVSTYDCELGDTGNTCGDGIRTGSEQCDATDLGGLTCERLGMTGTLGCAFDCQFDFSLCSLAEGPAQCGNGVVEVGEECDGNRFAPVPNDSEHGALLSCEIDALFYTGHDLCTDACRIDRSRCRTFDGDRCGDGIAELYEECDGSDLRGVTCAELGGSGDLRCTSYCILDRSQCSNVAGNGRREDSEDCDVALDAPTTDFGGATCQSLGYGAGELYCTSLRRSWRSRPPYGTQDPFLLTRIGTFNCAEQGVCGDGRATDGEECDGEDLAGASCATFDAEGELRCNASCAFDLSECRSQAECGDGRVSFGEDCEPSSPRVSCTADGGVGAYTCDPEFCFTDPTGCAFSCPR